ncbi:unnamed protein product [Mycena citricolor]|uniref:DNA polymerase kappa n=1 Tax=Mycena citricolor TaxID=2018698 RepID=A0AAD2HU49_9AGAR|nr:unnamed protein product [Mycena citricolor]
MGEPEPKPSQQSTSLLHRLAGPSTGKAGLAKDQAQINQVIADVSRGSKFYENEKRKDKELTKKIEELLNERDNLVAQADIGKVEAGVDNIIQKLELERDLTQIIVHFDLDSFFASVEVLNDPTLAGKAFAVGHSVISTSSYEARKFGVRSGMATFIAKKLCPQLILVSHGFSDYSKVSSQVMGICKRYDPQMCPAGCDEGYLNITAYCQENNMSADDCVQHMRKSVFAETKLTVSAGIAPNTMLAKICSDKNKPNGQFHLPFERDAILLFMRELPIRRIPGIGRVSERLLESIGIKNCGDIFIHRATCSLLDHHFGLIHLLRTHLGIASNSVQPPQREERKSIGAERTFAPLADKQKIFAKLDEVCTELESDMQSGEWSGRTVTLKYKLESFQVFTRAKSCDRWVSKKDELFAIGQELLLLELPMTIRLLGLRVTKLKDMREPDSPVGIKRFFSASGSESPRKKRKASEDSDTTARESVIASVSHANDSSAKPECRSDQECLICPVCSKKLGLGNDAFNAHLDSCLSREAIRQAQTESAPVAKKDGHGDIWERWASKPRSRKQ